MSVSRDLETGHYQLPWMETRDHPISKMTQASTQQWRMKMFVNDVKMQAGRAESLQRLLIAASEYMKKYGLT